MPESNEHLPIKVVIPAEEDYRRPPQAKGSGKDFLSKSNYEECRELALKGLLKVADAFEGVFANTNLPAVARVTLREEAMAKSHRPDRLLTSRTCPIIGGEDFGELLVSVRPRHLQLLLDSIKTTTDKKMQNDVVKILSIDPYTEEDALGQWTPRELVAFLSERRKQAIKVRLFNHRSEFLNATLLGALKEIAHSPGFFSVEALRYTPTQNLFRVIVDEGTEAISRLASFVGCQSVDVFDEYSVSTQATIVAPVTADHLPPPDASTTYPVVGLIDSGTDPNNPHLQAWVEVRDESRVPRVDQNNSHGSLVAALIINGKGINHDDPGFPSGSGRVVDVVTIPARGRITEDDLVDALRYAFQTYPNVKIWNMSLNSARVCRNDRFSSFGAALDALQDEFGVLVVNSAGNFEETPAHPWARPDLNGHDRLLAPADSLRAITVGSIAHISRPGACARVGEPSPFTRRGPGAAFVPKPDVCHFGGNASRDMRYTQMGILSVDKNMNVAETIGTSFAAPLVALTSAQLRESLREEPSRHLIKAFLIHSAVLHSDEITAGELPFKGFGKPPSVEEMLRCRSWEATLLFDLDLPYSRRHFTKADFPIPDCLVQQGKVFGEIILTLVYEPPVDQDDGAAYSQVNIDASLGMCYRGEENSDDYGGRKVIPYPKGIEDLYEKNQIEHGYKWSPVKVYRTTFPKGLKPRDFWRITLKMTSRKPLTRPDRQKATLIATIRDPQRRLPVYNEVVAMMNRAGWISQSLQIKDTVRIRAAN